MTAADPASIWGVVNSSDESRVTLHPDGGPDGGPFRRISVENGDAVKTVTGERSELGRNDWRYGTTRESERGTFMLYREGERKVTYISYRLPASFRTGTTEFNNLWQMKYANPSDTGAVAGPLSFQVRDDEFRLYQNIAVPRVIWSAPVVTGRWVDFGFDITYSRDPALGRVQVWADRGGGWVRYPRIDRLQTLAVERAGGASNPPEGSSVPSFLAVGIYHHSSLPPTHLDIADVRVELIP